jgi:hypothetical protein
VELLTFDAYRTEFIAPRAQFPPFERIASESLPGNFDMAKYLTLQCRDLLTEVIEIPVPTWITIWCLSLSFSAAMLLSGDDRLTLAWVWTAIGWILMGSHQAFQKNLRWALSQCNNRKWVNRKHMAAYFERETTERAALLAGARKQRSGEDAPGWTALVLPDPHTRSAFDKCIKGSASRQQLLFPGGAHTHHTNEYVARLFLLCFTIYASLLIMQFIPYVARQANPTTLLSFHVTALLPCVYYVSCVLLFFFYFSFFCIHFPVTSVTTS